MISASFFKHSLLSGGDGGDRTPYLLNAIQALSQVSYAPMLRECCIQFVDDSRRRPTRFSTQLTNRFCFNSLPKYLTKSTFGCQGFPLNNSNIVFCIAISSIDPQPCHLAKPCRQKHLEIRPKTLYVEGSKKYFSFAITSSKSSGFPTWSFMPAARLFSISSRKTFAVMAMMGTFLATG